MELNIKANQLARQLDILRIQQGSFIGIFLPRTPQMIITLLAILKSGSAYVPLNLYDPAERIFKICNSANITFIITNEEINNIANEAIKSELENNGHEILILEQLLEKSKNLSDSNLNLNISPENSAYIIFTSGTTGIPKGVLVKHKPVINLIEWVNNSFHVNYSDKLIWITNLSFDLSVYDIFGILAAGAILRILDDKERLDPELQLKIIIHEQITFWDTAPQCLQMLVPFLSGDDNCSSCSNLRLIFLSGDWIPLHLPDDIRKVFKNAEVVGLGGATEATIWSNYFIVDQIDPCWKSIPYGKPIQNAKYYILDSEHNHCGIMVPGDLYIGGKCLASEYYNDPELTNKKFIDDPYNPGNKMYFTGDMAQWMPDGNIEFLGRSDLQVKIRGYRIELGEIEAVLSELDGVVQSVVKPIKLDNIDTRLVAFIDVTESFNLSITEIDEQIRSKLSSYMIPSAYKLMNGFPLTANGKIDRKALNMDISEIVSNKKNGSYSMSETEQELYKIWSEALKTEDFSVEDNFFEIGGNSLMAVSVFSKILTVFNLDLSLRNFFDSPKIKDLAETIELRMKLECQEVYADNNTHRYISDEL